MEKLKFDIQIKDVKQINPLFSECKAYILYPGKNRNNSAFFKEKVDKVLYTLFNVPIIGEYNETLEDFRGHGGKIEITEDSVKYIMTTKPYGLVPESSIIEWEDVVEDTGEIRQYLTCTGFLWTGRYPEALQAIENKNNQSIEIDQVVGSFNKDGVYEIDSFVFSALTILGKDIEPCFESASITNYNFNKDEFKNEFNQMINELKFALNTSQNNINFNAKGGNDLEEEKLFELLQKYSLTKEQVLEFDSEINFETISAEDLEIKLIEFTKEPEVEIVTEVAIEPVVDVDVFSLTAQQLKDSLRGSLNENAPLDEWGWAINPYYYVDNDDTFVWAEERENNWAIVQFNYSISGEIATVDFASRKLCKIAYIPIEEGEVASVFASGRFEQDLLIKEKELQKQFEENKVVTEIIQTVDTTEFEVRIASLETENQELKQFKSNVEKQEKQNIIDKFIELTDDEKSVFVENIDKYSKEDLELQLFALIGKKKINFSAVNKPDSLIFNIPKSTGGNEPAWVALVEQYKSRNN